MDRQLLQLERDEISLICHKRLDEIIQEQQFQYIPGKMQDKILNLRDLIDRY